MHVRYVAATITETPQLNRLHQPQFYKDYKNDTAVIISCYAPDMSEVRLESVGQQLPRSAPFVLIQLRHLLHRGAIGSHVSCVCG